MTYKLIDNWLPSNKYYLKAPYAMTPKGIIVHNTASGQSAREVVQYMIHNNSPVSFHVAIDEKEAVQAIPFNHNAWHAGDGANGYANRNLIGIEIARSTSEQALYLQAEDNAVTYIAEVLKQYGWGVNRLYKHKQFSATACPHRTEELGWQRFINKVQKALNERNQPHKATPAKPKISKSQFQNDIASLKAKGITQGERPNDIATRGEVFALINRTINYLEKLQENK